MFARETRASRIAPAVSVAVFALAPVASADELLLDVPSLGGIAMSALTQESGEGQSGEKSEWKSNFDFGGAAAFGNTDNQSFTIGVKSERESEETRTSAVARYFYGSSNGERDNNRFAASLLQEWLIPDSRWLYFAEGRVEYDEFQSWEYRIGGYGGVGYELIENDDFWLTLRGGFGVVKEFNSDNEDLIPEALIGFDLGWQITEKQSFEAGTTVFLDLDDTGEYRSVSYARWELRVDDESNMNITAGIENEYQSRVDPGVKHNDFRFRAGVSFDF